MFSPLSALRPPHLQSANGSNCKTCGALQSLHNNRGMHSNDPHAELIMSLN